MHIKSVNLGRHKKGGTHRTDGTVPVRVGGYERDSGLARNVLTEGVKTWKYF